MKIKQNKLKIKNKKIQKNKINQKILSNQN